MQDVLAPMHDKTMIGVGREQTHLETELIETVIDHGMAGLILVPPLLPSERVRRCARKVPIVLIAWHEPGETACDTVNSDDRLGAVLAVQALVARGHRDIGFLAYRSPGGRRASVTTRRKEGGIGRPWPRPGWRPASST
jgi:LacI family transcriptional regulator